jgi:hypothetical protein
MMDTSEPVDDLAEDVEEYEEDVPDKEEVPTNSPDLQTQLHHEADSTDESHCTERLL